MPRQQNSIMKGALRLEQSNLHFNRGFLSNSMRLRHDKGNIELIVLDFAGQLLGHRCILNKIQAMGGGVEICNRPDWAVPVFWNQLESRLR